LGAAEDGDKRRSVRAVDEWWIVSIKDKTPDRFVEDKDGPLQMAGNVAVFWGIMVAVATAVWAYLKLNGMR
jgi:hypothetical protein